MPCKPKSRRAAELPSSPQNTVSCPMPTTGVVNKLLEAGASPMVPAFKEQVGLRAVCMYVCMCVCVKEHKENVCVCVCVCSRTNFTTTSLR